MTDLFAEAVKRVEALTGKNEEVSLHYCAGEFVAQAVNSCPMVWLGEIDGEYRGEGKTAEEALTNLIKAVS